MHKKVITKTSGGHVYLTHDSDVPIYVNIAIGLTSAHIPHTRAELEQVRNAITEMLDAGLPIERPPTE